MSGVKDEKDSIKAGKGMVIHRKALGILTILFSIAITTLYIARIVTRETKQDLFEYTVRADDTCTKIAVNFSTSVISIIEANHLKRDCSNIHLGQVLRIPYPKRISPGSPAATFQNIVIDCEHEKYTVKDGDTLDTIANKYKIPKQIISDSNGLVDDHVENGMQLIIDLCYPTPSP